MLICIVLQAALDAQESRATLEGRVTDQQGALIPGAGVEVTAEQTGVKQQTVTNELGTWTIRFLNPGTYAVTLQVGDKDGAFGTATARAIISDTDGQAPLVYQGDLQYLGAFRVPDGQFGTSVFDYGGTGLAFNAARNSLFIVGHDWTQAVAEIAIPQSIVNSNRLTDLATAPVLQPFVDVLGKVTR